MRRRPALVMAACIGTATLGGTFYKNHAAHTAHPLSLHHVATNMFDGVGAGLISVILMRPSRNRKTKQPAPHSI